MKVRLRPAHSGDLACTWRWHNDPEVSDQILSHPPPIAREREQAWLQKIIDEGDRGSRILRIIEVEEAGAVDAAGFVQLVAIDGALHERLLGIVIGEKRFRGRGAGGEALRQIASWAAAQLGLRTLRLEVRIDNPAAVGFYEHLGFVRTGTVERERRSERVFLYQMKLEIGGVRP